MADETQLLLDYARRGDVESLSAFVVSSTRGLMGYLRGMTPTDADAEDAFQECWIRVIKSAGFFRGGSARAYLMRIAHAVVIDRFRRRGAPTVSMDSDEATALSESLADDALSPAETVELRNGLDDVRRAVRGLPDGPREVLLMRIEGELSYRQIAEQLGIPIGTALTWMHVATVRLRRSLGGEK